MFNIIDFPNEILSDIFLYIKYSKNSIIACKCFSRIITAPVFKTKWFILYHESFSYSDVLRLGFNFFDIEVIKLLIGKKDLFIIHDIMDIALCIAIDLHKTQSDKNRVLSLEIFTLIDCKHWIGYYHEQRYGRLKINKEKAIEYFRLSAYEENNSDVIYRYAGYIINTNKNKEKLERDKCKEITDLFRKSADLEHIDSCYIYRYILYEGKYGNKKDTLKGYKYLKSAALKDKYFLIQAKCYSKYTDFLYDKYVEFIKDLKEQPKEYIGIFLVGTYSKYSVLKKKQKSIAETLKEETKDILNDSGHKIIICDDYELIDIIKNSTNLKDENKEITSSKLRIFKLSEEEEHEFLLKLHSVIKRKDEYEKLLVFLPSNTKFRKYVIRYEIKNELEYLKKYVDDFDISLNVFPSNIQGVFVVPEKFQLDILKHIVNKKYVHRLYLIGINI
ncbi:9939_t:CDS:2 [Scutellospora calospora]|uniref:9939_t:CDS:1 n=1 Tax=Scutellospora calospora TaxID=85575 RepID=A0ACA9KLJ6_9GLOM|nr:9939_t:CDS:2 [Scutellospora calospora]